VVPSNIQSFSLLNTSLIALLLGRLRMTAAEARNAYNSLATVIVAEPTEGKQKREMNMKRFIEVFEKVILDAGYPIDSPMRVGSGKTDSCKV
jgi:hypothetical protein